jgi:hypothetical protein
MKEKKGVMMTPGKAMFLTSRMAPISPGWIQKMIPKLAIRAGIQHITDFYATSKRTTKASHELRDLLKSIMMAQGCAEWVTEMCIGHNISNEYEKQAQMFPQKARNEYMKASEKLNVFSKMTRYIRGDIPQEVLEKEREVRELKETNRLILEKLEALEDWKQEMSIKRHEDTGLVQKNRRL